MEDDVLEARSLKHSLSGREVGAVAVVITNEMHFSEKQWMHDICPYISGYIYALFSDVGAETGDHHGFTRLAAFGNGATPALPFGGLCGTGSVHLQERAAHADACRRLH